MKLIIDIPKEVFNSIKKFKGKFLCENGYDLIEGIKNGTPLDDIKAEIRDYEVIYDEYSQRQNDYCDGVNFAKRYILQILDNIGKAENIC